MPSRSNRVPEPIQVYLVRGYTQKSRFAHVEDELRRALDSFRVLSSR